MTDQHELMIEELMRLDAGLSAWEIDFIESIDGADRLTDKQADKLREIYERLCA